MSKHFVDTGPAHARSSAARPRGAHQRGAVLIVGLIMLLLLTLHAISAFHTSAAQLRIVGNVQDRRAAEAAANQAIVKAMASADFAINPTRVAAAPAAVDIDGDGTSDFSVTLQPACRAIRALTIASIDAGSEVDFGCVSGTAFGSSALCAVAEWDVQATAAVAAARAQSGANVEVHQGASIRMPMSEAKPSC